MFSITNHGGKMTSKTLPKRLDKTLEWFEISRKFWKQKAKDTKEELKKRVCAAHRKATTPHLLEQRNCHYANFFHTACLSFSGTAHALEALHQQGKLERAPTTETCIRWEMKLGLHKLTRPKPCANDWIWIADHVVSKEAYKYFAGSGNEQFAKPGRLDFAA